MSVTTGERKEALAAAVEQELGSLQARGVRIAGNAFSPVLLSGADGAALRAALPAIGWEPQDFCALATVFGAGEPGIVDGPVPGDAVPAELFREALEALDPEAIVLLDDAAADAMREAYADALAIIEDFDTAMLKPGLVAPVLGRRVLALDGFEAALTEPRQKQRMWAYLKQLPPLGAPY